MSGLDWEGPLLIGPAIVNVAWVKTKQRELAQQLQLPATFAFQVSATPSCSPCPSHPCWCLRGLKGVTGFYFLVLSLSQVSAGPTSTFSTYRGFPLLLQLGAGGAAAWRPAPADPVCGGINTTNQEQLLPILLPNYCHLDILPHRSQRESEGILHLPVKLEIAKTETQMVKVHF